jgi:hypothetical protein
MTSTIVTHQLVPSAREDHPNINLKFQQQEIMQAVKHSLPHGMQLIQHL